MASRILASGLRDSADSIRRMAEKRVAGAAKGFDNQPFQIAGGVNAAAILGFCFLQQSVAPQLRSVSTVMQVEGGLCPRGEAGHR